MKKVSHIAFLTGCVPAQPEDSTFDCGLVRSSVSVSASMLVEPFEADLRRILTDSLRSAIDGDSFEDFFPDDCLLRGRQ